MVACSDRDSARAFDFFGLFGSDESPPPVSRTAISYAVTIDVVGGDKALKNAVEDASSLYKLRKDAPPDGDALARRASERFRPDHRRPVGRRLLRRDRHDLDRRRRADHSLERHRGLRARRGKLSQPRRRAGHDQRQSRPAVPLRSIRVLGPGGAELSEARAAGTDRRPQARRSAAASRPARGAGADRRLFPQAGPPARQGRCRSLRWSITRRT